MRKWAKKKKRLFCELFPFHYLVLNNLQGRGRERLISWFRLFVTVRHHKKAYISSSRHMSIMKKNIIKEATAANDYIRCHKKCLVRFMNDGVCCYIYMGYCVKTIEAMLPTPRLWRLTDFNAKKDQLRSQDNLTIFF